MKARIASSDFWERIESSFGTSGGVYKVACLQAVDSDETIPVQRLLGTDSEGVLYIGMAASFIDRVIDLKKSLSPQHLSRGHECGVRIKKHKAISEAFPYEQLVISFIGSDSPRATERLALEEYFTTYGELPPLNRAG
ncbi:hypothetical protein HBN76_00535 [Pseudomonas sp. WS 5013]|uniref:hypothetical protein n=1 Tax=Pseudomonas sp. WS 5013 TaxID=2717475 RepID=UPI00147332BB|nr:hypothetical protein [Pseudomonas sp. WS 5013]NMY39782.1 hypothetical protein [Pseudomonas sp. WS 5013]